MKMNFNCENEKTSDTSMGNYLNELTLDSVLSLEDEIAKMNVINLFRIEATKNNKLKEFEELYKSRKAKFNTIQQCSYLKTKANGEIIVNTSLLAEYIRQNYYYFIAKKQGSETCLIYWYEDGYYKLLSSNELKAKIKSFIPLEIAKPGMWENVYKDLLATDDFISFDELNTDEDLINFKNGLLNIKTNEFFAHSPKYKFTIQLNCEYHPNSNKTAYNWLNYIKTLTDNDEEMQKTLQEWLGLILSNLNANLTKKAIALYGPVGNTGKSKFINIIVELIGINNVCTTPIQDLSNRFGAAALYGTKCVAIDDQKSASIEDGSLFKSITGCGPIQVELKNKDPFPYTYRGGFSITCNALPYIKDDKGSHMFDRFLIIPCNNVIEKSKQDKLLLNKLLKEKDEIALWALEGLQRLIQNNFNLTESQASIEANIEYRKMNDSFFRFINEYYELSNDKDAKIKKTELENEYLRFCKMNSIQALDKKNIVERAKANGIICKKTSGIFFYFGLKNKIV